MQRVMEYESLDAMADTPGKYDAQLTFWEGQVDKLEKALARRESAIPTPASKTPSRADVDVRRPSGRTAGFVDDRILR